MGWVNKIYENLKYNCEWQRWGGEFYSQHGEDVIVLNLFAEAYPRNIEYPSYLDLGAHHPFNINNTELLYRRGSRGINVEPNEIFIKEFYKHRPEDINLCIGVGLESCNADFWMYHPESGKNSFIKERAAEYGKVTSIKLPVMTVNDIVQRYAKGIFPDFLSIDVEGSDFDVLKSIDYESNYPKIICIEMFCGEHGQVNDTKAIKEFMYQKNYQFRIQCGANGIFVR